MTIKNKVIGCQNTQSKIIRIVWSLSLKIAILEVGPVSIPGLDQTLGLVTLHSFSLHDSMVPHLKDLIHICLELEAQGYGMMFNRFYVG